MTNIKWSQEIVFLISQDTFIFIDMLINLKSRYRKSSWSLIKKKRKKIIFIIIYFFIFLEGMLGRSEKLSAISCRLFFFFILLKTILLTILNVCPFIWTWGGGLSEFRLFKFVCFLSETHITFSSLSIRNNRVNVNSSCFLNECLEMFSRS